MNIKCGILLRKTISIIMNCLKFPPLRNHTYFFQVHDVAHENPGKSKQVSQHNLQFPIQLQ